MKKLLPVMLIASTMGCSSSSDPMETNSDPMETNNALVGTWLSNCHEFLNTEDDLGSNQYVISELTITETEYVNNFTSFTDLNCSTDPVEESSTFTYSDGEMIATTDGLEATRISLTAVVPGRPDLNLTVEAIYRVSGVELNFGEYAESEIPSIDTRVTYIKQ